MTAEALEEPEEDEDKLEVFLPRLRDELNLLSQREAYAQRARAFAHWGIRQLSPRLSEKSIRPSLLADDGTSVATAGWIDTQAKDPRAKVQGTSFVATFVWTDGQPIASKDVERYLADLAKVPAAIVPRGNGGSADALTDHVARSRKANVPTKLILAVSAEIDEEARVGLGMTLEHLTKKLPTGYTLEIHDLVQLYDLFLLRLETYDLQIPDTVTFRALGAGTKAQGTPGNAIVLEVPLVEIYQLVKEHQLSLFSKNLRVPIAGKKYNAGIQRVLEDPTERSNFWYYNNGLTAICTDLVVTPGPRNDATVQARGFQVVNGCQTSMTVYNEGARILKATGSLQALEQATVLVRLIQLPLNEKDRASLGQKVARYTNSQTPITGRDLRATDPEQAKFKEEFAKDWHLFFETKKEEWKRRLEQNKAFKQNFAWPHVVSNEKAGQHYLSFWLGRPAFAKSHKKDIFENEELYRSIFGVGVSSEALLLPTFARHLLDEWRRRRGYQKRHTGTGSAHRISKNEVIKHGELYLLAALGASLQATLAITGPAQADILDLRKAAKNVRLVNEKFGGPFQGSLRKLSKQVDSAFDRILDSLFAFCEEALKKDELLTMRNLLVRDSTWADFVETRRRDIKEVLSETRHLLLTEFV